MAITLPPLGRLLDSVAVERAAAELTTALAVTRNAAVVGGRRARLTITADSLRVDRWSWGTDAWEALRRWPGPDHLGVSAAVSNPVVIFGPLGMEWGAAQTRAVLDRGVERATIAASQVGRVKRW